MLRSQTTRRWARAATSSLPRSQQATTTATQRLFLSSVKPSNGHWSARYFSSHSSFREPGSLFENLGTDSLTSDKFQTQSISQDRDAPLRADVRTMGSLLGRIIQDHHGSQIFERIEEFRALAKKWRETGAGRKEESAQEAAAIFDELATVCSKLSNEELHIVARAFTQFLGIANAAEGHHRCRLLSTESGLNALPDKSDSCGGVLKNLTEQGHGANAIYDCLTSQRVELVLTAHPTEVNRRIILEKQRRVQEILTKADSLRAKKLTTSYAQTELDRALEREIASLWQSDEVSRQKPSPQIEAERGTLVVETVLWEALPSYLRKLNATMESTIGKSLPLTAAPLIFSSWMGGDRDGNPNVTPETTREVCFKQRAQAAGLLERDLSRLERELSIVECSDELRAATGEETREPYREFLRPMIKKLQNTQRWAEEQSSTTDGKDIYISKDTLMEDLQLIHRSLCDTENGITADGFLTDVIRNVAAFGLTLVTLDIRQESDRHEEAIDSITRYLGLGSYSQWDEDTKLNWLQQQLASTRPLLRPKAWNDHPDFFSPTAVDTLEIFAMIADQHEESLGAYVISQATSASDVLAVLMLQRDAGVKKPLRVAPLFETLDDLNGAADTMKKLFSLNGYMGSINGKQEVMIGYSDSAKDAGRLAASWAQYETQEALAKVARDSGVDLTFFHGKGGTVGRGGNPQTFLAILAHAPDTINGKFRVTEQGEMITQNFGYADRAERTMDIYTAAVLAEKLTDRPRPNAEWRDMMKKLSDISCAAYRKVVRDDARFVPYFRSATPELELSNLNIGSRPAKRKASGGVESLRAIPWIFAWTQTRLNLPTWLGVGEAISDVLGGKDADKLRAMYKEWGSFGTTVDLVEMVLAKSEPSIAAHYDDMLVVGENEKVLGQELRSLHTSTEQAILNLTEHQTLSENNAMLQRLLHVRNPYVDCLNVLQAETLKRIRGYEEGQEDKILKDALLTTITGIANGMGNTG
jgi:phosphoenolpyruvate carboxylase